MDLAEESLAAEITRAIVEVGAADVAAVDLVDLPLAAQLPTSNLVGFAARRHDGTLLGALILGSNTPDDFESDALTAYASLAGLLGVGLDNARLVADQQRQRRRATEAQAT